MLIDSRFLRHVPVVYVDYPGQTSLVQIYGTFNRAMLRLIPTLRMYAEPLTNAMVELYLLSQVSFCAKMSISFFIVIACFELLIIQSSISSVG
jgi:dynein heavy chain 1